MCDFKSVPCELDYISGDEPEKIDKWLASIWQMAHSAAAEVQNHYSETLAAISRMLVPDVDNADEGIEIRSRRPKEVSRILIDQLT